MSNVQFDENGIGGQKSVLYSRLEPSDKPPSMVRFLLRTGIVKTTTQANWVLLGITVIALILSVFYWRSSQAPVRTQIPLIRSPLPGFVQTG